MAWESCLDKVVVLDSEFSKGTGYEINTQRSIVLT